MVFDKDLFGVISSFLCLIHCTAGPILLFLGVSTTGWVTLNNESFHLFLIAPILVFAAWSIPHGLSSHKNVVPFISALCGVIFLLLALLLHDWEKILTMLASFLLMGAHIYNKQLMKAYSHRH